jgi:hypothetical protein
MHDDTVRRCVECRRPLEPLRLKSTAVYCGERCRKRAYYTRHAERIAAANAKYRAPYLGRTAEQRWKLQAQGKAQRALKAGLLTREPCLFCGEELTEAHHHDYDQPLAVTWLCRRHHLRVHESQVRLASWDGTGPRPD